MSRLPVHWQSHLPKQVRKQGVVRLYGALLVSFDSMTARRAEGSTDRFSACYGLWVARYVRGEIDLMRELASSCLRDANSCLGLTEAVIAHRAAGITCWLQGDYLGARADTEQALAIYTSGQAGASAFRFGSDKGIGAMIYLAMVLWPLGEVNRASALMEDAIAQAFKRGSILTVANAEFHMCLFQAVRRDPALALDHANRLVDLAREHDLSFWLDIGNAFQGWAYWHANDRETGIAKMRRGVADLSKKGIRLWMHVTAAVLAKRRDEITDRASNAGPCAGQCRADRHVSEG